MPVMPVSARSVRDSIAMMTEWTAHPEGPLDVLVEELRGHLDGVPPDEALDASTELFLGMTILCGEALRRYEETSGVEMRATLRELARLYGGN